jgi:hypothetical protein
MSALFWIGLAALMTLAVVVLRLCWRETHESRGERKWMARHLADLPDPEPVTYNGLPPGVTRDASGWYSCPSCGGQPRWRCAQRNWSRRRR